MQLGWREGRQTIISFHNYDHLSTSQQANTNVVVENNIALGLQRYPSYICFSVTMLLLCPFLNPLALVCAIPAAICSCIVSCISSCYYRLYAACNYPHILANRPGISRTVPETDLASCCPGNYSRGKHIILYY